MSGVSREAHLGLPFANPMSEGAHAEAVAGLALRGGARVVDTGCGAGELLIRVLEAHPGWTGTGVDVDGVTLERARKAAAGRIGAGRVRFVESAAESAGLWPGAYDLAMNVGSSHVHGGTAGALAAMAVLVRPGGLAILGEGYWRRRPSVVFLAALGGASEGELTDFQGLLASTRTAGFAVEGEWHASDGDWEAYETSLAKAAERMAGDEAQRYAATIRGRRALPDCDTLGFALLRLRRAG